MKHIIRPLDENFYNPFDELDVKKKPKPIKLSDKGGILAPRREVFDVNRVQYSKKPNGKFVVIAKTNFIKGEIIEICPIIFTKSEAKAVAPLNDYIFEIDKAKNLYGIVLGYGSLYMHSHEPNVEYAYNPINKSMYFLTKRPIKQQEELTIDYGKDYWDERINFNAPSNIDKLPEPDLPEIGKVNDSEVQPNASDITGERSMKNISDPRNPGNPSVTGIPMRGMGQQ